MMAYSIEAAQQSRVFDEIIVSTESERIAKIAKKYNAQVPYLRRPELATDPYGVKDVLLDFFEQLPDYKKYDVVGIVLPTAPLIAPSDIKDAYSQFLSGCEKVLMSLSVTEHNGFRNVEIDSQGKVKPIFPDLVLKKSQELPQTFRINGAITFLNVKEFLIKKGYFFYPMGSYIMSVERSIDVDNEADFKLAEFYLSKILN